MKGIDELEHALADLADTAPDGAGMIEAVRADASRIRQRRRILAISATSAVLAVAMVGIPTAISGLGQRAPDPAVSGYRKPLQLTVGVAPKGGYQQLAHGVVGSFQYLTMRSGSGRSVEDWSVFVHDPGTYDAGHLRRGERMTIQGRPAYYVSDLSLGRIRALGPSGLLPPTSEEVSSAAAVGWQDPAGAWVLVTATVPSAADVKESLVRAAESVRIGPPRDIMTPFSLGYIPEGLRPLYAGVRDHLPDDDRDSVLSFGTGTEPLPPMANYSPPLPAEGLPLTIRAMPLLEVRNSGLGPATPIAGYDTWYIRGSEQGWTSPTPQGSTLIFETGRCTVFFRVADRERIPLAELTRMLENARFDGCAEGGEWVRPLR